VTARTARLDWGRHNSALTRSRLRRFWRALRRRGTAVGDDAISSDSSRGRDYGLRRRGHGDHRARAGLRGRRRQGLLGLLTIGQGVFPPSPTGEGLGVRVRAKRAFALGQALIRPTIARPGRTGVLQDALSSATFSRREKGTGRPHAPISRRRCAHSPSRRTGVLQDALSSATFSRREKGRPSRRRGPHSPAGKDAPHAGAARFPISSSAVSALGGSVRLAGARFSRKCSSDEVPGMSRMLGER
jgi:hypothetical protein